MIKGRESETNIISSMNTINEVASSLLLHNITQHVNNYLIAGINGHGTSIQ